MKLIVKPLYLLGIGFLIIGTNLSAQTKFERESRIKTSQVPSKALAFLKPVAEELKVKWYYEENLKQNSFEAKYYFQGQKFSVEFDTFGNIQDIEIIKTADELPKEVVNKIHLTLKDQFKKYKIRKIQQQFTGQPSVLQSIIEGKNECHNCTLSYELVIKGATDSGVKLYEYLFAADAKLMEVSEIILDNANNLEY